MRNYSTYIAEGINVTYPIWTQPYEDAFGFGRMVTVSMPVYYSEKDQNGKIIRKILGVVGVDVIMQTIFDFGKTEEEAIQDFMR